MEVDSRKSWRSEHDQKMCRTQSYQRTKKKNKQNDITSEPLKRSEANVLNNLSQCMSRGIVQIKKNYENEYMKK